MVRHFLNSNKDCYSSHSIFIYCVLCIFEKYQAQVNCTIVISKNNKLIKQKLHSVENNTKSTISQISL